jgi:aspartate/methionine/tyrosine aminotransferase
MNAASRLANIAPFHVMELLTRARALEAEGRDIIHMEVGEPDFPTPAPVIAAAQQSIAGGRMYYTPALGLPELREAIAGFYEKRYGISVPASRIAITSGASGALALALACLVEPGSEWLLTDPGYPCNRHFVRTYEGIPVDIPVDATSNFQPTVEHLQQHWNERTRGALFASPANPTGTMLSAAEILSLAEFTRARHGQLIIDEIYHGLTYEDDAPTALAAGNDIFISPSTPAQYAALAAFSPETIDILESRRNEFRRRRDFLAPTLESLGFKLSARPQGAFYIYADCSALTTSSARFANELLEQAGVAATPGLDFGKHAPEQHLRFAYTTNVERLAEAAERIHCFVR